jgi:molybdenum cofactor synthesis domain-containing protein
MEPVKGKILSVNISEVRGVIKTPRDEIRLNESGIEKDAHGGDWHRQVSLLGKESFDKFIKQFGRKTVYGEFAENLTTSGIDLMKTAVFDRFTIGEVELEITQLGKHCHGHGCAIYTEVGNCVMPKEGIFCRVIKGGVIKPEDEIIWHPRPLRIRVITLSDRASKGEYEDKSGPHTVELLKKHFDNTRWHTEFSTALLPDDPNLLERELHDARSWKQDIVFTVGGTGVGPRDIAPDVILNMANKTIPGIMDAIRLKYGADKPNALLSRSVAAVLDGTLVYALPGSVKAVNEYVPEILKTTEHLLLMLHEINAH